MKIAHAVQRDRVTDHGALYVAVAGDVDCPVGCVADSGQSAVSRDLHRLASRRRVRAPDLKRGGRAVRVGDAQAGEPDVAGRVDSQTRAGLDRERAGVTGPNHLGARAAGAALQDEYDLAASADGERG